MDRAVPLFVGQFQVAEINDAPILQCHLRIVQDDVVELIAVVHVADAEVKRFRALLDGGLHVEAGQIRVARGWNSQLDLGREVIVEGLQFLVGDALAARHELQPGVEDPMPVVGVPAAGLDVLVRVDEGEDPAIKNAGHQFLLHCQIVDLLVAALRIRQGQFHRRQEVGLVLGAGIVARQSIVEVVVKVRQLALGADEIGAGAVGGDRIGAERDAVRVTHHGVAGNLPGGLEVFLHHHRRHRHALGVVVETLPAHAVAGEVASGVEIHAGEIADGVVVLGPVQAAQGRLARVLDGVVVEFIDRPPDPGDKLVDLALGHPGFLVLRRHDARLDLVDDAEPLLQMDQDILLGAVVVEVQAALAFLAGVAVVAVFLEDRLDFTETLLKSGVKRGVKGKQEAGRDKPCG